MTKLVYKILFTLISVAFLILITKPDFRDYHTFFEEKDISEKVEEVSTSKDNTLHETDHYNFNEHFSHSCDIIILSSSIDCLQIISPYLSRIFLHNSVLLI